MKRIEDFAHRFGVKVTLDRDFLVKSDRRYFLLKPGLKELISGDFFSAGLYLGRIIRNKFSPSFNLLRMIACEHAKKTFVDERTEWLFICGRDIFAQGITKTEGLMRKCDYTLILNQHDECLGFGEVLHDCEAQTTSRTNRVAVRNVLDIGDFLRREK